MASPNDILPRSLTRNGRPQVSLDLEDFLSYREGVKKKVAKLDQDITLLEKRMGVMEKALHELQVFFHFIQEQDPNAFQEAVSLFNEEATDCKIIQQDGAVKIQLLQEATETKDSTSKQTT